MKVEAFDFDLPGECIAQRPARPRDKAKLLKVEGGLGDFHVGDLPTWKSQNRCTPRGTEVWYSWS